MTNIVTKIKSLFFARSPWISAFQKYRPNLVADTIHQIMIECRPKGKILNIGAGAREYDPLNYPYFREHQSEVELFGINISHKQAGKYGNFIVINGTANQMPFEDESFDCIICNAMMEHDPKFWLTLGEVRRVLKTNGLFIAGAPGFINEPISKYIPFMPGFTAYLAYQYDLSQATLTYTVHGAPLDYYRFSRQAFLDVVYEGFEEVQLRTVMRPPRIIGHGRKGQPHR